LIVGGLAFVPFAFLTVSSVADNWRFPRILPAVLTFRAWIYLFESTSGVILALANSTMVAFVVSILAILIALPAARALTLHDFKFKKAVLFFLLLPILSPSFVVATGSHALLLRYNLTDSIFGVILAHLVPTTPYAVLLLTGSFARFDIDFEAQARSLGANAWNVFRYVTFPAIAPGMAIATMFAFLISWSQYLSTLFVGGGKIQTLPLILVSFQRSSDEAITAALTLIFLAPTIFVFVVVAKFLKE
jgi:putative spermidine/putrescine transport system permease protein